MKAPILSLDEAVAWREGLRSKGEKVAFANGVFDLLHVGHVRYLLGARALADALVVAVNSDASTRANKGPGRPRVPEQERVEIISALRCVDAAILFDDRDVSRLLKAIRPDVHVKGTDYTPETIPERAVVEAYGGRVAIAGDPKDHSTTSTIATLDGRGGAPTWADVIACPKCKERLADLTCSRCRLRFRVDDEVPVLLLEEAIPLTAP